MDEFLINELEKLRDQYVTANPRQRLHIIEQRLNNPGSNPNVLVTYIASVEALARTLIMNSHAKTKNERRAIYRKYRYKKVENMIREYLRVNEICKAPDLFGVETWKVFRVAVEYRNLLIHECTSLGRVKFDPMVDAAKSVLDKLIEVAKLRAG